MLHFEQVPLEIVKKIVERQIQQEKQSNQPPKKRSEESRDELQARVRSEGRD
jgi:hypothetical protein